jgi:predicted kinase
MAMTPVRNLPRAQPGRTRDPGRMLVVLGGLPGSGKTTLLRRMLVQPVPGVVGLDPEQVTDRMRASGVGLPYRWLRPLVHAWHRLRVVWIVGGGAPVVVLTDPWTSGPWRSAVLQTASGAGRSVRVVLIDASRKAAEDGQAARGRVLSARAMRRHTARWTRLLRTAGDRAALVVDRAQAGRLTLADVLS